MLAQSHHDHRGMIWSRPQNRLSLQHPWAMHRATRLWAMHRATRLESSCLVVSTRSQACALPHQYGCNMDRTHRNMHPPLLGCWLVAWCLSGFLLFVAGHLLLAACCLSLLFVAFPNCLVACCPLLATCCLLLAACHCFSLLFPMLLLFID